MSRKLVFSLVLLVVAGLLTSGIAMAQSSGVWERVFTASGNGYEATNVVLAIETFKDHLYTGVNGVQGVQIFRSPDGQTWEAVSAPSFGYKNGELPAYYNTWDMQVFKGGLYVAINEFDVFNWYIPDDVPGKVMRTRNGVDWSPAFDPSVEDLQGSHMDKLGVFNAMIYLITVSHDPVNVQSQAWRSPSGDPGTWELVAEFGNDVNSFSSPTAFNEYVYLSGYSDTRGLLMWRSADGLSWEPVEMPIPSPSSVFRDGNLVVYKDRLYLSTLYISEWGEGALIYRTADGVNWEEVVDYFDDPANIFASGMVLYHGDLYAPVYNYVCDCDKLYVTQTGNPGDWELVDMDGDRNGGLNLFTDRSSQAVFRDELYLAGSSYVGDVAEGAVYRWTHP